MAKHLRQPQPSSSVARLFDLDAAARAVAPQLPPPANDEPPPVAADPQPEATTPRHHARPAADTPSVKRELVLTRRTDDVLNQLVDTFRRTTGTKLTASHVARAFLTAIAHCMDHVGREARRVGPLKLPSNARDNQAEREHFEAQLADALIAGMRAAPAPDWQ